MKMATPAQISTLFLTRFFAGDDAEAASLLSPDFCFLAPLQEVPAGKETYFAGAAGKTRFVKEFRILRQWEDGPDVSTLYELRIETSRGSARLLMHDWHTIREERVAKIVMLFDTRSRAARLLGAALSMSH